MHAARVRQVSEMGNRGDRWDPNAPSQWRSEALFLGGTGRAGLADFETHDEGDDPIT